MKIYLIEHPDYGFLGNNRLFKEFTPTFNLARKFNRRSDASNCLNTTSYMYGLPKEWETVKRECKIVCYTLEIVDKQEF